jgi:hypothetical protein
VTEFRPVDENAKRPSRDGGHNPFANDGWIICSLAAEAELSVTAGIRGEMMPARTPDR